MAIIDIMRDSFWTNFNRIEEIDGQLDPTTASKTKLLNDVVKENQATVDSATSAFDNIVRSLSAREIAAVVHAMRKALRSHSETVDTFVKENLPENGEAPKLDEATVSALNDERTKVVAEAKAARAFVLQLSPDERLPKVSARAKGQSRASGPRLKGTYNFSVDGEPVDGHTLSAVKLALKAENAGVVRKAIIEQVGEIWDQERERFEFTFGEHRVVARLVSPSDSGDDDDVDVDEEDDSEDDDELFN